MITTTMTTSRSIVRLTLVLCCVASPSYSEDNLGEKIYNNPDIIVGDQVEFYLEYEQLGDHERYEVEQDLIDNQLQDYILINPEGLE